MAEKGLSPSPRLFHNWIAKLKRHFVPVALLVTLFAGGSVWMILQDKPLSTATVNGITPYATGTLVINPNSPASKKGVYAASFDLKYRAIDFVKGINEQLSALNTFNECGETRKVALESVIANADSLDLTVRGIVVTTACQAQKIPKQVCDEQWVRLPFGAKTRIGLTCSVQIVESTVRSSSESSSSVVLRLSAGPSIDSPINLVVDPNPALPSTQVPRDFSDIEAVARRYISEYIISQPFTAPIPAVAEMVDQKLRFSSVSVNENNNEIIIDVKLTGRVAGSLYERVQAETRGRGNV